MKLKTAIIVISVFFSSFLFFSFPIIQNTVPFESDEMYWINTAKIVPLLLQKDYTDIFWNEYYGFTNFNTAKFIFGIGLPVFGHSDFSKTGVPPQTYYNWMPYEGAMFPASHALYTTLRDARLISALFTAISVSILYLCIWYTTHSSVLGLIAAFLLASHPIVTTIATHAFADGIFLMFETLLCLLLMNVYRKQNILLSGIVLAFLVGTKLNGLLFVPFALAVIVYRYNSLPTNVYIAGVVALIFTVTFLLIHPNLFFYKQLTLSGMLQNRLQITDEHIAYFSQHDPSHVILNMSDRILSSLKHLFTPWLTAVALLSLFFRHISYRNSKTRRIEGTSIFDYGLLYIWIGVLTYCVFDEPRYFLPVLPLLIIAILTHRV